MWSGFVKLFCVRSVVEEIEELVARAGAHPIWGYTHCLRVYALARRISEEEDLDHDDEVLRLAALLHDIGLYRAYSLRAGRDHVRRSMSAAAHLLRDADFPERKTTLVLDAIEHHPPGTPPGRSAESALLSDAVALDYLGAVGLSRIFAMVGTEEDVPDLPAALRHARNLRRRLPNSLRFESSRDIARERCARMDEFFEDLKRSTMDLKLL